jgi:predicted GIY-YIG superfamily endonuclease
MPETTSLYRFYRADRTLLYVGITRTLLTRLKQHSGDKEWFTEVRDITVEHLPSRDAALAAEKSAIVREQPLYNVVHNTAQRSRGVKDKARERPFDITTGRWLWHPLRNPTLVRRTDLYLEPEINCSTMVEDYCELDAEGQLWQWIQYMLKKYPKDDLDAIPVDWSVVDHRGCHWGYAPYQGDDLLPHAFLRDQSWPVDATTGEKLDWFKLPIRWGKFAEASKALDWTPGRMQRTCPLISIMASKDGHWL